MSGSDFVFSNARVKSKEAKLLSEAQVARLVECKTADEAFKLLTEYGYGVGVDNLDFDAMFDNAEKELDNEFAELAVPESGLEAFVVMNDYHNLKALLKMRALGQLAKEKQNGETSQALVSQGLCSVEKLQTAVSSGDYNCLSDEMAKAVKTIDAASLDGVNPRFIDVEVDKAMYKEVIKIVKAGKRKELIDYFTAKCDLSNVSAFLRAKRLSLGEKFFADGFIEGGEIGKDFYLSVFEQGVDAFADKMRFTKYSNLIKVYTEVGIVGFEVACDNYLLDIFKNDRNDMFTASPIAGDYLGKKTELKTLNWLVAAIKNNVDGEIIKQRMRDLYA